MDAFFSLPRGGAEIGGILLGSFDNGRLVISDYAALDCEHANGPSFTLSPRDEARLTELVAAHANDTPAGGARWGGITPTRAAKSFCPKPIWRSTALLPGIVAGCAGDEAAHLPAGAHRVFLPRGRWQHACQRLLPGGCPGRAAHPADARRGAHRTARRRTTIRRARLAARNRLPPLTDLRPDPVSAPVPAPDPRPTASFREARA